MNSEINYKTLAVDPGTKRVGLAICDELGLTTRMLPVLPYIHKSKLVNDLIEILRQENCFRIVIGLPLNMDGSTGESAKRSENLAKNLEKLAEQQNLLLKVILWDERLTSFEAEQRLKEMGISKKNAKDKIDSLAAQVLLEDYLAQLKSLD